MTFLETLLLLIAAHAYFDYAGQGDFMAKAKNQEAPIPGVPWYQPLTAHAAIHGGAVGLITGSLWLGIAEFVVHWVTDHLKCHCFISYNTDQAVHVGCKVLWAYLLIGAPIG